MADSATQELDKLFDAARGLRRYREPQWYLNLSYYDGNQWVAFDGLQLHEPQLEEWRAKLVDNRIRPMVRTEIAKLTKSRPVWVGVPKAPTEEEVAAARLRERLFEHHWMFLRMQRKRRAALLWSRVTGAGFWKITWDSTLGEVMEVFCDRDGRPLKDTNGAPFTPERAKDLPPALLEGAQTKRIHMGDVRLDLKTPFEMFVDPLATEEGLDSADWIGEESLYSPEYVARRFPKFAETLQEDGNAGPGIAESRLPSDLRRGAPGRRGHRLREYWCKPNATHPRGKHVVYSTQGTTLLEENLPYPWLPYVMFIGTPVPGRFWPSCVVDDLISPQTELNKRKSQIAENAERIGNPPRLKPSNWQGEEWLGLPGEEIEFQPDGTETSIPRFMSVPELPTYVREDIERIENSFREISGQHEVTSGNVPAGVTAASAINLLLEQDDTRLGPDIEDMEEGALRSAGRRVLWLCRNFYSEEKGIRLAGDDGVFEWETFRGKDLRDEEEDGVQIGSGLPQSKAAKQAAIQQMLTLFVQNGVPIDERSLRKVLRDYEVGGLESMLASVTRDERQVNDENRRLLSGEELDVNTFDNDQLHIAGHEDAQKTARYAALARSPEGAEIQQSFEAHVKKHRDRFAAAQAALQPPPGPPGSAAAAQQPAANGSEGSVSPPGVLPFPALQDPQTT